jgi:hypothetical protein
MSAVTVKVGYDASTTFIDSVGQVIKVSPQSVELPAHQGVAQLKGLEPGREASVVVQSIGGQILRDTHGFDSGCDQGIALQIEDLGTV